MMHPPIQYANLFSPPSEVSCLARHLAHIIQRTLTELVRKVFQSRPQQGLERRALESLHCQIPRRHQWSRDRELPVCSLHKTADQGLLIYHLAPKPMWQVAMAAKYTFTVEKAFPLSIRSCRNDRITSTESLIGAAGEPGSNGLSHSCLVNSTPASQTGIGGDHLSGEDSTHRHPFSQESERQAVTGTEHRNNPRKDISCVRRTLFLCSPHSLAPPCAA